jgi:hypothetical protein
MKIRPVSILVALLTISSNFLSQSTTQLGLGRKYSTIERMSLNHLAAVHQACANYQRSRTPVGLKTGLTDFRAVLHAHAEDSPHTGGTRPEMLKAAQAAGTNVIMLTDHRQPGRDFIDDSWRGFHESVLFIPGSESDGFLIYPISSIQGRNTAGRDDLVSVVKAGGGNIFLSHVEDKLDWPTDNLDGMEIYNHHTDVKDEAAFYLWLQGALTDPTRLAQIQQGLADYPQEVFAAEQDYLSTIIKKWDADCQVRRLTGVAANDCHHNQVFTITAVDDQTIELGYITSKPVTKRVSSSQSPGVAALARGRQPGELIAKLDFDPYERSFRYVSTHILAKQLTEQAVREALRSGRAYVAHDWLCNPAGFAYVAESVAGEQVALMGDQIPMQPSLMLKASAPVACSWKIFRNGEIVTATKGRDVAIPARGAGVYRVEAWLEVDGEMRPWIYSNPIYIR